jgi:hypothetical protein
MSAPNSDNVPRPDSPTDPGPWTDSENTIYISREVWGDTTVRPRPPEIPLEYPRPRLPRKEPPEVPPSDRSSGAG